MRPYDTSQKPFFEFLGTPPEDKRHVVLEGGHLPPQGTARWSAKSSAGRTRDSGPCGDEPLRRSDEETVRPSLDCCARSLCTDAQAVGAGANLHRAPQVMWHGHSCPCSFT
jgi:hypothetical protein